MNHVFSLGHAVMQISKSNKNSLFVVVRSTTTMHFGNEVTIVKKEWEKNPHLFKNT